MKSIQILAIILFTTSISIVASRNKNIIFEDISYYKQSYEEIVQSFYELAEEFPEYIRVHDAAEQLKELNRTLPKTKCYNQRQEQASCKYIYAELTNFTDPAHVNFTQSFFSGNFHGDEIVGPNVVSFLAQYILHQKRLDILSYSYIVLLPLGNPSGYFQNSREEIQYFTPDKKQYVEIDMNRDFPYDSDSGSCFRTAGARVINFIWQQHLFTGAITFHGGMTAIGWPWGSGNHAVGRKGDYSPDHFHFLSFAQRMTETGSKSHLIPKYPIETLTNVIYPVGGSFEDWSYAQSWEKGYNPQAIVTCSAVSQEENYMNENIARSLTYLIETSNDKGPNNESFGRWSQLIYPERGIGHVSRNIKLTLEFIENLNLMHVGRIEGNQLKWKVQGCSNVNQTRVYYREVNNSTSSSFEVKDLQLIHLIQNYPGSLSDNQSAVNQSYAFNTTNTGNSTKQIEVFLFTQCDTYSRNNSINTKPTNIPQSHFARRISHENYVASNNGFSINSKKTLIDSIGILEVAELPHEMKLQLEEGLNDKEIGIEYAVILVGIILVGFIISFAIYLCFKQINPNNNGFDENEDQNYHQKKGDPGFRELSTNVSDFGI